MNKKKLTKLIAVLASCTLIIALIGVIIFQYNKPIIPIDDEKVPSSAGTVLLEQNFADLNVVPDKYNTGYKAKDGSTTVTGVGTYNGVGFANYGENTVAIYYSDSMADTIVFENYDFSNVKLVFAKESTVTKNKTIKFINCKFSSVRTADIGDTKVTHIFENSSFTHFDGSNSSFNNCYFGGGSDGDGINPFRNCTFTNCMIADLVHKADSTKTNHVDGMQIFGDSSKNALDIVNISFQNCRFEVPYIPFTFTDGLLNCPITFTVKYSNLSNIAFNNVIVNGGQYYSVMLYNSGFKWDNVSFNNIKVGGSRKNANVITDSSTAYLEKGFSDLTSLYIGSVWKGTDGIHLSVTNDTTQERKLKIVTSNGTYEHIIPACPVTFNLATNSMTYNDFPFDLDILVKDADWVVAYDVTSGTEQQIRFVNYTGKAVYYSPIVEDVKMVDSNVAIPEVTDSVVLAPAPPVQNAAPEVSYISSGSVGNAVNYTLTSNGILTLSGTGDTNNYNSSKVAPWKDYRSQIVSVVVNDGITRIGDQLFASLTSLTSISLPETVTTIGSNAFLKSSSLATINLPASLTSIGKSVFAGTVLKTINYNGTQTQWAAITIGDKNEILSTVSINYKEETIVPVVEIIASGVCGTSATWTVYNDGSLQIGGSGAINNYNSSNVAPWNSYNSVINTIFISEEITSIGTSAFASMPNITSVSIPKKVTTIGSNAFLKSSALTSISFSSNVTSVGKYAFAGTALTSVTYYGTADTWAAMTIGTNNEKLTGSTITYQ